MKLTDSKSSSMAVTIKEVDNRNGEHRHVLRRRAATISFAVGIVMFVLKSGAYLLTHSAAILSDASESVVHVVATGVALYSIILASRPADRTHPYGYGKAEYFSAGVEGALIVVAAIAICYEAGHDLIFGSRLKSLDVGTWAIAAAGAINLLLGWYLIRTAKRTNSLVLRADGQHVLTDSYTSIGVLVGLILVQMTHVVVLDPIFAIAVALNIIVTGYRLVHESIRGLMNVADPDTIERVVRVMNRIRTPDMLDIHRLRAWSAGERRFVDFHLTLPHHLTLEETHTIYHIVHDAISKEFNNQAEVLIHLDPFDERLDTFLDRNGFDREFNVAKAQGEPTFARRTERVSD
jgi:cation diffusion facilitator family transporter